MSDLPPIAPIPEPPMPDPVDPDPADVPPSAPGEFPDDPPGPMVA